MKKTTIISVFILVIAIALAGYFTYFKTADGDKSAASTSVAAFHGRETLTYVPADTLFFFGGISTIPLTQISAAMAPQSGLQNSVWTQSLNDESRAKLPPAMLMLMGLMSKNIQTLQQPDAAAKLGVGPNLDMVSYSIGFIPVIRIKLADAAAFNHYIDEVEQYTKLKAGQKTLSHVNFRAYSFAKTGYPDSSDVDLLIGVNNGYAIISVYSKVESTEVQNLIAGTAKPTKSLATISMLPAIQAKYHFLPSQIGFINHRAIINGITSANGNEFGRMLDTLVSMAETTKAAGNTTNPASQNSTQSPVTGTPPAATPTLHHTLDTLRSQACRVELTDIINRWPKTVFGYTKLDLNSTPHVIQARMEVENTDLEFIQKMQRIRGFIPAMLRDSKQPPVFGLGLGLNVDALSPFIADAIRGFTAKDYQCEYLMQLKQKLLKSNPAIALGMMAGMANGLRGISASILDIEGSLTPAQPGLPPDIKKLDAIVTVSSNDPQRLLMMAANFLPNKQPLQLPADGSAIDFPVPFPLPNGAAVKLALKGNTIVAYTGTKAEKLADSLSKEPIQSNGLLTMDADFGKYMELISGLAQNQTALSAAGPQAPARALSGKDKQMLAAMAKIKLQYVESFDIDNNGIALNVKMTSE